MAEPLPSRISVEIDFEHDGKQTGFARLPHSVHRSAYGWLPIPIACIRNGRGPSVLLSAGNHGDEWEGQVALAGLIRELRPEQVRGRLIILPSANFPAAMAGTRTSPIDDGNLNRSFPGDRDGGPTRQIAHWIEHGLMPLCDHAFDFHSGGSSLMYVPSSLSPMPADAADAERVLGMMRAFGAPVGYIAERPEGDDRTLGAAASRQGVRFLGTELGGGGMVQPEVLKLAREGIRRLLVHVGALRDVDVPPPGPTRLMRIGGDDYYVYAPEGGVFEPLAELGEAVAAGQPAARVHFPDTPWRAPEEAAFKRAGTVLCKRVPGRCERGDCLFHLGTDRAD